MLAVLLGAQDNEATGATIGRWIDDNFVGAVSIAAAAAVVVVVTFVLLVRGYGRQRRKNRRMRRDHEVTVERHLEALNAKIDELRGDVGQLGELEDHVVAQLRLMREALGLSDADRFEPAGDAPPLPRRPLFSGSATPSGAGEPRPPDAPRSPSGPAAASVTPSAMPRLRRSSLTSGLRRSAPTASPSSPSAVDPLFPSGTGSDPDPASAPALLVETGEPLAYSTRQR